MNPNDSSNDTTWGVESNESRYDFIVNAETHAAKKKKPPTSCLECGFDLIGCTCSDCACSYCTRMGCSCQPSKDEDEHGRKLTVDDADDQLISKAAVPNLGALFRGAKQSGLITSTVTYN